MTYQVKDYSHLLGMKGVASIRGPGWAVVIYDPAMDFILNTWVDEHHIGNVAGTIPLLVLDLWEHAILLDYGTDRKAYLEAFFNVIDWSVIGARYDEALTVKEEIKLEPKLQNQNDPYSKQQPRTGQSQTNPFQNPSQRSSWNPQEQRTEPRESGKNKDFNSANPGQQKRSSQREGDQAIERETQKSRGDFSEENVERKIEQSEKSDFRIPKAGGAGEAEDESDDDYESEDEDRDQRKDNNTE